MTVDDFLADWHSNSEGIWVHTSGTTGTPKPMYVLKQHMRNSARATCDFLGLQPGDGAFLCMSVDYIAGKMMVVRSLERQLQLIQVPPSGHPLHGLAVSQARASLAAMVPLQVYNSSASNYNVSPMSSSVEVQSMRSSKPNCRAFPMLFGAVMA